MKHVYDISVVFFVEVENDERVPDYLLEREKIRRVLVEQFGFALGEFDFLIDSISERVSGTVNSIKVQKT